MNEHGEETRDIRADLLQDGDVILTGMGWVTITEVEIKTSSVNPRQQNVWYMADGMLCMTPASTIYRQRV